MKTATLPVEKLASIRGIISAVADGKLVPAEQAKTAGEAEAASVDVSSEIDAVVDNMKTAALITDDAEVIEQTKQNLGNHKVALKYASKLAWLNHDAQAEIADLKSQLEEVQKKANVGSGLGRGDTEATQSSGSSKSALDQAGDKFAQSLGVNV